jgi:hypothetical protein
MQALPFEPCHQLAVSLAGSGSGTVSGPGVFCPGTCSQSYAASATLTLTASAAPGSVFAGWSGACNGTGSCHVAMGADRSVGAEFVSSPSITALRQSASRWREGRRLAQITKRTKPPVGTTFSFALNERATVSFTFLRSAHGRRVGRRCVASGHRRHRGGACRAKRTEGALTFTGHSGTNRIVFQGRISRTRKLKPGRYTLVVTATNVAGQGSAPASLGFMIVR